jgi:hypothetical protein
MTKMDILQEVTGAAIHFHSMRPEVSEWMQRLYPTCYSAALDSVSFENPSEVPIADRFRQHAKSAGFNVPSDW